MTLTEDEENELGDLEQKINCEILFKLAQKSRKTEMFKNNYCELYWIFLSQELVNQSEGGKRWVELVEKEGRTGFCQTSCYSGKPYAFVVEKNVPEEFRSFVGIHEANEANILPVAYGSYTTHMENAEAKGIELHLTPPDIDAHRWACRVELWNVFLKGKDFATRYIQWLPDEYFTNADPKFLEKIKRDISPLEFAFQFIKNIAFHEKKEWIKEFPWLLEKCGNDE